MSEYIVDTFGIVQDFADLHGDMNTPLYQAIMDVMMSRQHEEIVRCRDCIHYKPYRTNQHGMMNRCHDEHGHTHKRDESDFCSRGERRSE